MSLPARIELPVDVLDRAIPDQSAAIAARAPGYDHVPIDTSHPLYDLGCNPLVLLSDFNIDSLSYYAHKNTTGDAIPGVHPEVRTRADTARRLDLVNTFLRHSDWVKQFCGGEVELHVDDGLRTIGLQRYVAGVRYPEFLRRKLERHPGETDEEFEDRVQQGAADSVSKAKVPPHSTGGVVDLKLIRLDGDNKAVSNGKNHAVRETVQTDYYENNPDAPNAERFAKNRRLLYHAMAAVGGVVNPMEPWHFGFVDLADRSRTTDGLSAVVSGATHAFYDSVPGMPDADPSLQAELERVQAEKR